MQAYSQRDWPTQQLIVRIALPVAEHVDQQKVLAMWAADAVDYAIIGGRGAYEIVQGSAMLEQLGLPAWTQSVGLGVTNVFALHICAAAPGSPVRTTLSASGPRRTTVWLRISRS